MVNQLKVWQGACDINDQHFDTFPVDFKDFKDMIHIKLYPCAQKYEGSIGNDKKEQSESVFDNSPIEVGKEYKITVKQYMTRKASPEFDFMAKFNNDNPMPLRTMTGVVEKETKGMVYMHLHGQAQEEIHCLRCGRELTNPISRLYGIGPECIHKIPIFFNIDINDVDSIKEKMMDVEWSGWIIKSALTEKQEI